MNNVFENAFNAIDTEVKFNYDWNNGTGYFDAATRTKILPGQMVKTYDEITERRIILIGTKMGTIVVFERYKNGQNGIYVANFPSSIPTSMVSCLGGGSSLSKSTLENWLGTGENWSMLQLAINSMYDNIVETLTVSA